MVGELLHILKAHHASSPSHKGEEDPVFARKDGVPFTSYRKPYEQAVDRAGLKRIRFHDLRHSASSAMIAAGIQEPIVQRIMGHKSAIMTRHYTHVHADQVRDAMSRFSEALEAAAPEKERGER